MCRPGLRWSVLQQDTKGIWAVKAPSGLDHLSTHRRSESQAAQRLHVSTAHWCMLIMTGTNNSGAFPCWLDMLTIVCLDNGQMIVYGMSSKRKYTFVLFFVTLSFVFLDFTFDMFCFTADSLFSSLVAHQFFLLSSPCSNLVHLSEFCAPLAASCSVSSAGLLLSLLE